jgi:transcriptional regulator with XRE-family HTH domain
LPIYAQHKATYVELLSSLRLKGGGLSVTSIKQTVRENIRRLRIKAGLSQQKLAERTGKSLRYINYLENRNTNVTIEVLEAIANGIGVSVASLVNDPTAPNDLAIPKGTEPGLRYLMGFIAERLGMPIPDRFTAQLTLDEPNDQSPQISPNRKTIVKKNSGGRKSSQKKKPK